MGPIAVHWKTERMAALPSRQGLKSLLNGLRAQRRSWTWTAIMQQPDIVLQLSHTPVSHMGLVACIPACSRVVLLHSIWWQVGRILASTFPVDILHHSILIHIWWKLYRGPSTCLSLQANLAWLCTGIQMLQDTSRNDGSSKISGCRTLTSHRVRDLIYFSDLMI